MLVLEIAGGIILAVVLLSWWREILAIGVGGVVAIVGAVAVISVLNAIVPFRVIGHWLGVVMPWLVLVALLGAALGFLYAWFTGKWKVSEEEAREWAAKSAFDRWVSRIATASAVFLFGGSGLAWALSAIGVLK